MAIDKEKFIAPQTSIPGFFEYAGPLPWNHVSDQPFTIDDLGPYYKYNPQESKKLREQAGYKDGKIKVNSAMVFGTGKSSILGTTILQELWKQEGIDVSIQLADIAVSRDVYYNRAGEDLMNTFQNTGDFSLNWFAQNKFKCENFQNTAWICDPEIQKTVKEIQVTSDPSKQRQLAKILWDFDTQQVYNIWLPTTPSISISGPRVRNYVIRQSFTNQLTTEWLTDGPRTSP